MNNRLSPYILITLLANSSIHAADVSWTNPAGGDFNDSSNWAGGLVPTNVDRAIFDSGINPNYTVAFTDPLTEVQAMEIGDGDITFDLQNNELRSFGFPNPSSLSVGDSNNPTILNLQNGTIDLNASNQLAHTDDADVTVITSNLTWIDRSSIEMSAGNNSQTILNITNSSDLDFNYLIMGSLGDAAINIDGGSSLNVDFRIDMSEQAGSITSLNISGAGTGVHAPIHIGSAGNATVTVEDGGSLSTPDNRFFVIGDDDTAVGRMIADGTGSLIDINASTANLGWRGSSQVSALNGGTVDISGDVYAASQSGSHSTITADGNGSMINFLLGPSSRFGGDGLVFINAQNGGIINLHGTAHFDNNSNQPLDSNFIRIEGSGSSVNSTSDINIFNYDVDIHNGGSLTADRELLFGGELDITGNTSRITAGSYLDLSGDINIGAGVEIDSDSGGTFGTFNIDGAGANWSMSSNLSLYGGDITVTDGAAINVNSRIFSFTTHTMRIQGPGSRVSSNQMDSRGNIDIDGGELIVNDTIVHSDGDITLDDGLLSARSIEFSDDSRLNMNGGELHLSWAGNDLDVNGGTVNVGTVDSPEGEGRIIVNGTYSQSILTTLSFEIGGTNRGFDYQLLVADIIELDGTLKISLVDGFLPQAGDDFFILGSGLQSGIYGDFAIFDLPTLPTGLGWEAGLSDFGCCSTYALSVISTIPVPAAVWLFGTGLLTLIGVARRGRSSLH